MAKWRHQTCTRTPIDHLGQQVPKSATALLLRPARARCGCRDGQHLARSCPICCALHATPLLRHHEQRLPVWTPEHASEAAAVKSDRLQHLTAFTNAHATLVGDVPVPNGAFRVEANTVWDAITEVGPHPPVGRAAVGCDVERREPVGVGLSHYQRRVVGCHDDAIGKCDDFRYLPNRTIGSDQCEDSGGELATWEVEAYVADVSVATTVHGNVVPGVVREAAQVGMGYQRPVGLPAQQKPISRRDYDQAPIWQPVDAKWERRYADDDFALALEIDGNDLLRAPVREPETLIVPARRLAERDAGQQGL